jgi:uncharacterized membrane protein
LRRIFLVTFLLNIGLNLFSLLILPATVAIHFSLGGRPDHWASKETHAMLMLIVGLIVFLPIFFAPSLIDNMPPRWLSLPYKQHWLREENRGQIKQLMAGMMSEFGIALFGFLSAVTLLTIDANHKLPVQLNENLFLVLFTCMMLYTFVWTIRLVMRLRPPRKL